jgi:hypothetical protein
MLSTGLECFLDGWNAFLGGLECSLQCWNACDSPGMLSTWLECCLQD